MSNSFISIGDKESNIQDLVKNVIDNLEDLKKLGNVRVLSNYEWQELENIGLFESIRRIEGTLGPAHGELEWFDEQNTKVTIMELLQEYLDFPNAKGVMEFYLGPKTLCVLQDVYELTKKSISDDKVLVFMIL